MALASPRPPLRWLPLLLAWSALALVFLPQALLLNLGRPEPWPAWMAVLRNVAIFLLWVPLTLLALRALRRWPPLGAARWRNGLRLAGVALGLAALHVLAMAALTALLAGGADPWRLFAGLATGLVATNLLMAAAVFFAGVAQLQGEARRDAEAQLAHARLASLRQQLQPHFLFNTLNALAELVHADAARAEAMLLRLSSLLRRALDDGERQRVSLAEELDFLDGYLEIQQALLGERLRIERAVGTDTLNAAVPPMLLQPLVENALRHGLGARTGGGVLRLPARRDGDLLELRIADDGTGARLPLREGVGLANTRARLLSEYRGRASLQLRTAPGAGFAVTLHLPADRP